MKMQVSLIRMTNYLRSIFFLNIMWPRYICNIILTAFTQKFSEGQIFSLLDLGTNCLWSVGSGGDLKRSNGGAWVLQSAKHPPSAQVMILQFVSSSPALGSVLIAQSLEPGLDSVSPSLSSPPLFVPCFSLSLNNK